MKHDKEEDDILYQYLVLCRMVIYINQLKETLDFYEIKNESFYDEMSKEEFLREEIIRQMYDYTRKKKDQIIRYLKDRDFFRYEDFYTNIFKPQIDYNVGISLEGDAILVPSVIDDLPLHMQDEFMSCVDIEEAVSKFTAKYYKQEGNLLKRAKMISKRHKKAKMKGDDYYKQLRDTYLIPNCKPPEYEQFEMYDFEEFLKNNTNNEEE